jgi:hypothetical protein
VCSCCGPTTAAVWQRLTSSDTYTHTCMQHCCWKRGCLTRGRVRSHAPSTHLMQAQAQANQVSCLPAHDHTHTRQCRTTTSQAPPTPVMTCPHLQLSPLQQPYINTSASDVRSRSLRVCKFNCTNPDLPSQSSVHTHRIESYASLHMHHRESYAGSPIQGVLCRLPEQRPGTNKAGRFEHNLSHRQVLQSTFLPSQLAWHSTHCRCSSQQPPLVHSRPQPLSSAEARCVRMHRPTQQPLCASQPCQTGRAAEKRTRHARSHTLPQAVSSRSTSEPRRKRHQGQRRRLWWPCGAAMATCGAARATCGAAGTGDGHLQRSSRTAAPLAAAAVDSPAAAAEARRTRRKRRRARTAAHCGRQRTRMLQQHLQCRGLLRSERQR